MFVRSAVEGFPATPFKILKQLAVDKIVDVIYAAISSIISRPESKWK
jgi:hypothetical protein